MELGDVASVLAVSWGKGDPQRDAITLVYLDNLGRLRETTKIDNLLDQDLRDEFIDVLKRRNPDVIIVGGFRINTNKLTKMIRELLHPEAGSSNQQTFDIPITYVHDEVARIYQHSKRSSEFSALSPTAKYCVGLARYAQSPLNEYAALGSDITAISIEDNQHLVSAGSQINESCSSLSLQVPPEKLLVAFERALVDVTTKTGVDINRAATDSYYQHLLPFVCGLGPRKAQLLLKKIAAMVLSVVNVSATSNNLLGRECD